MSQAASRPLCIPCSKIHITSAIDSADLAGLLSARPPKGAAANTGRAVCACYGVGEKTIANAIRGQGLDSVEAVGACLKAGTGCGSCVPEIRRMLKVVEMQFPG